MISNNVKTKSFTKYQSLGNDFVLFDWREDSSPEKVFSSQNWPSFVQKVCDRHFGVGADGVLVVYGKNENLAKIFNADGGDGQLCMNGARCIAHYLHTYCGAGADVTLHMGGKVITHHVEPTGITQLIDSGKSEGEREIETAAGKFLGHVVNVGNPHFIIFSPITREWLVQHGAKIEQHPAFPHKTNVEFIWSDSNPREYRAMVYERGCGITLACSSGAAAITWLLVALGKVSKNETIFISMPGGQLQTLVDKNSKIVLRAEAKRVFCGTFSNDENLSWL